MQQLKRSTQYGALKAAAIMLAAAATHELGREHAAHIAEDEVEHGVFNNAAVAAIRRVKYRVIFTDPCKNALSGAIMAA